MSKKKITDIREAILAGNAEVSPYEMGNKNACTYCPYQGTCGFDRKIPGYEFRRLKQFADDEIWKAFGKEVETNGSNWTEEQQKVISLP